jgi:hypothetical protein
MHFSIANSSFTIANYLPKSSAVHLTRRKYWNVRNHAMYIRITTSFIKNYIISLTTKREIIFYGLGWLHADIQCVLQCCFPLLHNLHGRLPPFFCIIFLVLVILLLILAINTTIDDPGMQKDSFSHLHVRKCIWYSMYSPLCCPIDFLCFSQVLLICYMLYPWKTSGYEISRRHQIKKYDLCWKHM